MKFGGYNLKKASKEKRSIANVFSLRKIKSATHQIIEKFSLTFESFHKLRPYCESPLSFQGRFFEKEFGDACAAEEKFSPLDFRSQYNEMDDRNYLFGANLLHFSANRTITGKPGLLQQHLGNENVKEMKNQDGAHILKPILETSSCDESLEYRVIQEYLENNSYSDIETDSNFRKYLEKKNYSDVLNLLQKKPCENKNQPRITSKVDDNFTLSRKREVPRKCRKSSKPIRKPIGQLVWNHKCYEQIFRFCDTFFAKSIKEIPMTRNKEAIMIEPKYNEESYRKFLQHFVQSKGYPSVEEYINRKFGTILDNNLDKSIYKIYVCSCIFNVYYICDVRIYYNFFFSFPSRGIEIKWFPKKWPRLCHLVCKERKTFCLEIYMNCTNFTVKCF